MIRISGLGNASAPSGARKASRAGGDFRVGSGTTTSAASAAAPKAPVETLSALIALQSETGRLGNARAFAAARKTLDLLDEVRLGLIEGAVSNEQLDALADAASARAASSEDPTLQSIYEEIALRARVELAKLGR